MCISYYHCCYNYTTYHWIWIWMCNWLILKLNALSFCILTYMVGSRYLCQFVSWQFVTYNYLCHNVLVSALNAMNDKTYSLQVCFKKSFKMRKGCQHFETFIVLFEWWFGGHSRLFLYMVVHTLSNNFNLLFNRCIRRINVYISLAF